MNNLPRTFQIHDLNSPDFTLRKSLTVVQQQSEGKWKAIVQELPDIYGEGEGWPFALADLQDNLVGAVKANLPQVMALVVPRDAPLIAAPAAMTLPVVNTSKVVFVLTEENQVVGVTSDEQWAARWDKWNPKGSFVKLEMEKLP